MIGSLGAQRSRYCCDSSDHHQPRLGARTGDRLCGRPDRTSPRRGDAAMPRWAYVPDVPLFMIRGGTVSNEDLEAVVATRTALSGVLPGWVAR
jgi:hypothetical protein